VIDVRRGEYSFVVDSTAPATYQFGPTCRVSKRPAEAGELPRACGRAVPDLSPACIGKLLLRAIADGVSGRPPRVFREFAALATESGAKLIDLLKGWISGNVSACGLHFISVQLRPAGVTIVNCARRLHYGDEHSHDGAARIIVVPGSALRAIVAELRGASFVIRIRMFPCRVSRINPATYPRVRFLPVPRPAAGCGAARTLGRF
jgi:hypothetical protein